jgi:tetratricopeptide (TPR) repeat protein
MKALSYFISLFFTLYSVSANAQLQGDAGDTASINSITRDAYLNSRRSPDQSIQMSYKALALSRQMGYIKGSADASLALGMAYLAKYNPGDSATFFNMQALDLYGDLDDIQGKARACYALSYAYSFKGNLPESEKYGELSFKYFEQDEDRRGMVNALSVLIYLARQSGDNEKALDYSGRAIETSRAVSDINLVADAINTRGNIFKDMLLYNEAIDSYFEALDLWELKSDSAGLAIAYGSIGLMYYYQEEYSRALEFNFMKLPLSLKSGNIWEVSKTMNNISQIYSAISMHDSSLFYLRESLKLNEQMNLPQGIANVCSKIAATFINLHMIDSASLYINRAISIAQEIDDPELADYLVINGRVLKREGKYREALKIALRAYKLVSTGSNPEILAETYALMSDMYYRTGEGKMAMNTW